MKKSRPKNKQKIIMKAITFVSITFNLVLVRHSIYL